MFMGRGSDEIEVVPYEMAIPFLGAMRAGNDTKFRCPKLAPRNRIRLTGEGHLSALGARICVVLFRYRSAPSCSFSFADLRQQNLGAICSILEISSKLTSFIRSMQELGLILTAVTKQ